MGLFFGQVHFGHVEGSLDPRMKPFLFGSRLGHCIFDLNQTKELLATALHVAAQASLSIMREPSVCLCCSREFSVSTYPTSRIPSPY